MYIYFLMYRNSIQERQMRADYFSVAVGPYSRARIICSTSHFPSSGNTYSRSSKSGARQLLFNSRLSLSYGVNVTRSLIFYFKRNLYYSIYYMLHRYLLYKTQIFLFFKDKKIYIISNLE